MDYRYSSFDLLKGISCIAVVLIHYNFNGDLGLAVKAMCRFAVPIFFFISGFFFLSNDYTIERSRTIRKSKHILSLIIKCGIFYMIFCILWSFAAIPDFNIITYAHYVITKAGLVKLIITNDPFIYSVLWFILALFYIYISFLPFNNKKVSKYLPYIALSLLLIYNFFALPHVYRFISNSILLGNSQKNIIIHNFYLFRAMPFFLFGMWARIKENEIKKFKISKLTIIFGVLIGLLLSLDASFSMGNAGYYMGSYLILAILTIAAIQNPNFEGKGILKYIGEKLSLYVYIFHIAIGKLIDLLQIKFNLYNVNLFMCSRAFMVLFLSLLFAWIIYKLNQLNHKFILKV